MKNKSTVFLILCISFLQIGFSAEVKIKGNDIKLIDHNFELLSIPLKGFDFYQISDDKYSIDLWKEGQKNGTFKVCAASFDKPVGVGYLNEPLKLYSNKGPVTIPFFSSILMKLNHCNEVNTYGHIRIKITNETNLEIGTTQDQKVKIDLNYFRYLHKVRYLIGEIEHYQQSGLLNLARASYYKIFEMKKRIPFEEMKRISNFLEKLNINEKPIFLSYISGITKNRLEELEEYYEINIHSMNESEYGIFFNEFAKNPKIRSNSENTLISMLHLLISLDISENLKIKLLKTTFESRMKIINEHIDSGKLVSFNIQYVAKVALDFLIDIPDSHWKCSMNFKLPRRAKFNQYTSSKDIFYVERIVDEFLESDVECV